MNLPDGPVFMSPDRLLESFQREVIYKKPEVIKILNYSMIIFVIIF